MNSFIGTKEAARRLGISMRRVQALIAAGRLPAEKVGNSFAIREQDLAKVNGRKNGHPLKNAEVMSLERRRKLLKRVLGRWSFDPPDLTTNRKHMERYGRD